MRGERGGLLLQDISLDRTAAGDGAVGCSWYPVWKQTLQHIPYSNSQVLSGI